jgi:hypothetical protein
MVFMEGEEVYGIGPYPEGAYPTVKHINHLPRLTHFVVNSDPHEVAPVGEMGFYRDAFYRWSIHSDVVGVCVHHDAHPSHRGLKQAELVFVRGSNLHYFEPRSRHMTTHHVTRVDPRAFPVTWFVKSDLGAALFG